MAVVSDVGDSEIMLAATSEAAHVFPVECIGAFHLDDRLEPSVHIESKEPWSISRIVMGPEQLIADARARQATALAELGAVEDNRTWWNASLSAAAHQKA